MKFYFYTHWHFISLGISFGRYYMLIDDGYTWALKIDFLFWEITIQG